MHGADPSATITGVTTKNRPFAAQRTNVFQPLAAGSPNLTTGPAPNAPPRPQDDQESYNTRTPLCKHEYSDSRRWPDEIRAPEIGITTDHDLDYTNHE